MWYQLPAEQDPTAQKQSSHLPFFPARHRNKLTEEEEQGEDEYTRITVASTPDDLLRQALERHFPRATPFSLLLLQIVSFEHIQMPPGSPVVHKRLRRQVAVSLLEQVVQIARRALRADDQILLAEEAAGAVFLFPQVDQEGMACIFGRVSSNIRLLQAETVIPPLQQETEILLGSASYPEAASSPGELIARASQIHERITLRPAVLPQSAYSLPCSVSSRKTVATTAPARVRKPRAARAHFPFMQIPSRLPARLKPLIPYPLALDLRCAPVGRDHNRLTVAMANPADTRAIGHLRSATGMTIFPVACEISALEMLLASGW